MFSLESKPFKQIQTVLLTSLKLFYYIAPASLFFYTTGTASSNRPDGCDCDDGSADVCSSACCDAVTQKCADPSVCASECASHSNRTAGCTCLTDVQCASNCCGLDQTCKQDASACSKPCEGKYSKAKENVHRVMEAL